MKSAFAIGCLVLLGGLPGLAQNGTYDSRLESPPHVFTWKDVYSEVGIWESAHADINGGFLGSLNIRDWATANVTAGNVRSLEARENASLLVLGVETDRIATRDHANIDMYGGEQSPLGQVLAGGDGAIRIFGGHYGWVMSWPGLGGRVELFGGFVDTLSSEPEGTVVMNGGEADRLYAGESGLTVLDSGTVRTTMSADGEEATLVVAGGFPPPDILLFGGARMIVLHTGGVESDYVAYRLADFDVAGVSTNCAGREVSVHIDDANMGFKVSAWSNTNYLGQDVWRGRLELVRIRDDLQAFGLAGGRMLLGFLAPGDQVLQLEVSNDLVNWQPWKAEFPGDGNTHAEVLTAGTENRLFFRLRKWPKPGS